jgi:hypothetical protein
VSQVGRLPSPGRTPGEYLILHGYRATDRRQGINVRHACPARHLKELRPGSSGTSEIRTLFAFDPWRSAILLIAGDKSGRWNCWYTDAIPRAEHSYDVYLKERAEEETGR